MIDQMLNAVKAAADPDELGMILVHNGIVRGTSKDGRQVNRMRLSYDRQKLVQAIDAFKKKDGIVDIQVRINQGELCVGDDIMHVIIAGKFRKNIVPVFEDLLTVIKNNVVTEQELF